ncbi:inosine/xanthosine triphosphate pyrophosphatase family protein [Salirhabdus euzebyi]|uniref:Inosine/xanthosine triphosphate pyrophosphatase family protein n=1 Tax=Salirhabdus euzebyi TaxID=394506 RepID=A0A841Q6W6_9BACI|nr:YozQ family protein [Salirhabdus euzebyi]MBB6454093.1 inosine/xanthosine triphosphate pyrophosphatase family protein [Salirhabdus euzebyi]
MSKERDNQSLSDKVYEPADYKRKDQLSSGIALTHEQSSDTLVEGTIDGKIERENGDEEEIPRKGFNK